MTATITPYQSTQQTVRDGFGQLLRAEWTKLRTVRGWVITVFAVAAVTALAPIDLANSAHNNAQICTKGICTDLQAASDVTGPGGGAVTDNFYFLHQTLDGNGSITVRLTSLRGSVPVPTPPPGYPPFPSTQPWAKAGVIVKESTKPGSPYAAVMATPGHGVRMQYNFTNDVAGPAGAVSLSSPRWLRLTRTGSTLTGYASTDGTHWAEIGAANLTGLPRTVQAGLFVASPDYFEAVQTTGGSNNAVGGPSQTAAVFDHVIRTGQWSGPGWSIGTIGHGNYLPSSKNHPAPSPGTGAPPRIYAQGLHQDHMKQSGGTFTLAGSGDIAPAVPVVDPVEVSFYGTTFGLIAAIALGAMFITTEYRRGMIRTTLTASPRRGRVLAAKVIVIGSVTFVAGLIGAAVAFTVGQKIIQSHGWKAPTWQVWSLTSGIGVHVVVGTAAMLAMAAILALALGTVLRRAAGAVTSVIALLIFPVILAIVLPLSPANWLMRLTPAAAFSLQQALPQYAQQTTTCLPYNGCYPLAPWAGFAVLCAWAVVALGGAVFLLRWRDA